VISEGRTKANKSALEYSASKGFFDQSLMDKYASLDVSMHLFEYTAQMENPDNSSKHTLPIQMIYAIKEHNGGKLDSHYWFFNAFADQLNPEYTFLIDIGTKPEPLSIVRLFAAMERDPQIGGCCGEIAVDNKNYCSNAVTAAQVYEYKTSNFMGKCFESLFGYIAVLPGAFSAYRFQAIKGQPLQSYFYSMGGRELSPFKANMYLAEDRVLCLELVAKQNCNWILKYISDAPAVTVSNK
jgi:chitin synthase